MSSTYHFASRVRAPPLFRGSVYFFERRSLVRCKALLSRAPVHGRSIVIFTSSLVSGAGAPERGDTQHIPTRPRGARSRQENPRVSHLRPGSGPVGSRPPRLGLRPHSRRAAWQASPPQPSPRSQSQGTLRPQHPESGRRDPTERGLEGRRLARERPPSPERSLCIAGQPTEWRPDPQLLEI